MEGYYCRVSASVLMNGPERRAHKLTSPADFEALAASAQILTSNPEELTAEDVTAAAQVTNTLLLSPNATESVRVAAVATVSQLQNANTPDDGAENNATLGLTVTLDELSVNLSLTLDSSMSKVVQPNLAVQSAQVPAADTQGVQFTSLSGTSGSFVANRIKLNTNTSSVVVDDGGITDALIYVRFPPEAVSGRQKPSNVSLGFVLYQNDNFFRSRHYKSKRSTIRVLSGSVSGQEPQHVEIVFRPTIVNGTSLYDFACVFWNYSLHDWSTDGCSKGNASDGLLRCFCNHTTNFAAFFSLRDKYEYAALDWISAIGVSISIICLFITVFHHIREILLAYLITFVSGVVHTSRMYEVPAKINTETNRIPDSGRHVEPDGGSCTAVAALLHFFLLANFMWISLQSYMLWQRGPNSKPPKYWIPLSFAVGWGVPAVIMAITLGATYRVDNPLGYRQEEFCWLAALDKAKQFHFGKPMFGGFLLPIGLILIYNIVLLVMMAKKNLKEKKNRSPLKMYLSIFSLVVLMGLSWTLGYLVLVTKGHAHLVFSIIFCLCTTTQGIQIFIVFTVGDKSFRDTVSRSPQYISSIASQSGQYISSMASRSGQYVSSMASRSGQYVSSMASRSGRHISSINIGFKRRKYRFDRESFNMGSTGSDEYFRFREEPISEL
ncbi:adhesion G-protein coupled receptor G7-like [Symphorus nematophorus]